MSPLAMAVLSDIVWFGIFILAHLVWTQVTRDPRFSRVIARSFLLAATGSAATIVLSHGVFWHGDGWAWVVALGAATFLMACAFVLYMPFVFVIATSLSVDTLLLLYRADGQVPRGELYNGFVSAEAVRGRLEAMRGNGLLELREERYHLTQKGASLARFFAAAKRFWKLGPGG